MTMEKEKSYYNKFKESNDVTLVFQCNEQQREKEEEVQVWLATGTH